MKIENEKKVCSPFFSFIKIKNPFGGRFSHENNYNNFENATTLKNNFINFRAFKGEKRKYKNKAEN